VSGNLRPYLKQLGLPPGATFKQITARYYARIEQLDDDQEADRERLDHAFRILKRAYTSPTAPVVRAGPVRRGSDSRFAVVAIALFTIVTVGGVFLTMNYDDIKVRTSNYEVGKVVRWKNSSEPYGRIVQFSREHAFPTGNPAPAYEIRLEGALETVWLGERVVEKGMLIHGSN
jgi:hypothetical protein